MELFIRMISGTYEIKKQVIGEDADLEQFGRILNRVVKWGRDGITIEADQRHIREILKDVELEQTSHAATPCYVEKSENIARSDGSNGENQCEQEDCPKPNAIGMMRVGDDKNGVQMTNVTNVSTRTTVKHSQVVTSRSTEQLWRASVLCHKIDQILSLRQCRSVVRWQTGQLLMERVRKIGRYLVERPRAECLFRWQQSGELEAYPDSDR